MYKSNNHLKHTMMKLETPWDFVEKYYPNYYSCDDIARSNDLEVLINNEDEENSCARELLNDEFNGVRNIEKLQLQADLVNCKIYESAIEAYIKQL